MDILAPKPVPESQWIYHSVSLKRNFSQENSFPFLKGWRRKPWIRNLVSRKDNSEWPELQTFIKWFKANEAGEARRRWTSIYRELSVPREAYSFDLYQDIS